MLLYGKLSLFSFLPLYSYHALITCASIDCPSTRIYNYCLYLCLLSQENNSYDLKVNLFCLTYSFILIDVLCFFMWLLPSIFHFCASNSCSLPAPNSQFSFFWKYLSFSLLFERHLCCI